MCTGAYIFMTPVKFGRHSIGARATEDTHCGWSAMSLAAERWKILQRAIFSAKSGANRMTEGTKVCNASRKFRGFGLFHVVAESGQWLRYSCFPGNIHVEGRVKILEDGVSLEAMVGFNNTGNLCVWPAEEVLANYCLEHCESFQGCSVCELGCGMTGLAGLMLACTTLPSNVLLTDGNEKSVCNVMEIIEANKGKFGSTKVSCDILRWDSSLHSEKYCNKFEYVLCADCLFFEDHHYDLLFVIQRLLKPNNGMAVIFAPRRGRTLENFCGIAKDYFQVQYSEHYSDRVLEVHRENLENYNPDLHYPVKITLKNITLNTEQSTIV